MLRFFEFDSEQILVYDARACMVFLLPKGKLDEIKICLENPDDETLWHEAGIDIFRDKGVMVPGELDYVDDESEIEALNRVDYNIKNILMRKYVLEVTERCNFMCTYCFNATSDNFRRHTSRQMSLETACKAMDYYFDLYTGFYSRLDSVHKEMLLEHFSPSIGFYGGEPIMNFDVVEKSTEYLMSLDWASYGIPLEKVDVTLNTNLSDVNEKLLKYLTRYNAMLFASLDGVKQYNDAHRVDARGEGTFERAYNNLMKIKEYDPEYFKTRVSILAVETDDAPVAENHKFLDGLGCHVMYNEESPYGCFVRNPQQKTAENLGEEGEKRIETILKFIDQNIETDRKKCLDHLNSLFYVEHLLTDIPLSSDFRSVFVTCPMGADNIMIGVEGDMHICHKTDGSMPFGNVHTGLDRLALARIYSKFVKTTNAPACRQCWAFRQCRLCGALRMKKGNFINPEAVECDYYRSEAYLLFRLFIEVYRRYPDLLPELFEYRRDFNNIKEIVDYNEFIIRH